MEATYAQNHNSRHRVDAQYRGHGPRPSAPTRVPQCRRPLLPELGNGGYDVQHYNLDLRHRVSANWLNGSVTIDAIALQDLSTFNLDFIGLTITQLTVNGEPAQFTRSERELTVRPSTAIPADVPFTVVIRYYGNPIPITPAAIPFEMGWNNYGNGVYVASEPSGAATWYPVNDHPTDKATYTFQITVNEPYVAAANGVLVDTQNTGAGDTTYIWEMTDPMASYLTTVQIAEFTRQDAETVNGVTIRNYFPDQFADAARRPSPGKGKCSPTSKLYSAPIHSRCTAQPWRIPYCPLR